MNTAESLTLEVRHEALLEALDAAPELRWHHDREHAIAAANVLTYIFGPLSPRECGLVLGVSEGKAETIERIALTKVRLAGGRELREAWE